MQVSTIGLDLAKNVFQVHGIAVDDAVVFNRPLRRAQVLPFFAKLDPCLIGIESCSSAHHWARELSALGHDVRLITRLGVSKAKMKFSLVRLAMLAALSPSTPTLSWPESMRNLVCARPDRLIVFCKLCGSDHIGDEVHKRHRCRDPGQTCELVHGFDLSVCSPQRNGDAREL